MAKITLAGVDALTESGGVVTIPASTTMTFADGAIATVALADDAVTGTKIENNPTIAGNLTVTGDLVPSTPLSHRNIIINGDMYIAQRGTSSTSTGYRAVDRWGSGFNAGTITQSQSDVASGTDPYNLGFRKAFKITNGGAVAGAGHYVTAYSYIEAQDIAKCGWKYTDTSSYITISFWIKSSVAGTFYGKISTQDGTTKEWVFPFTLVAATWKKITQSFPGHASLQFDNNTARGLEILIPPFYGTDFTASGATTGAWAGYSGSARFPDYVNWGASSGATWEITGVQLELGSNATPFEHRSYGEELLRCQRYCMKIARYAPYISGSTNGTTEIGNIGIPLPCAMRTTPTMAMSNGVATCGVNYWWGDNNGASEADAAFAAIGLGTDCTTLKWSFTNVATVSDNRIVGGYINTADDAVFIIVNAEL